MSEATARANAFVSAHLGQATALGERSADLIGEPETFVAALAGGLATLDDPDYTAMTARVSPDVPAELMVRGPLVEAVQRPLRAALHEASSMTALHLAGRLITERQRSLRLFAVPCLARSLAPDPEQTWQEYRSFTFHTLMTIVVAIGFVQMYSISNSLFVPSPQILYDMFEGLGRNLIHTKTIH